ncbi:MAG: carboxypeptidase-like regulatory domain-containing protein, partial [Thermoplasmata archaeon]|nr:carboxypeptidase-like regulatory domain-containing protein [Thermoplasmata archaeon]
MVDSRLFPFSGSNTGIFYAPADLTDRVIGAGGAPTSYYTLTATGSDGQVYQIGQLPAGVTALQYNINYLPAFYNTMIYRVFIGYSGADIGSSGIPGISGSVSGDPLEPGWMMQHFRVVYRTAYYCPFASPTGHPGCFSAMNLPDANALAKANNGTSDGSSNSYFGGGEAMLQYYPGQPMTGTVTLPNGAPVSQARVTVYDEWNIPHMTTLTSTDGAYSVILPPGNDTVNVTVGTMDGRTQAGTTMLLSMKVPVPNTMGLSLSAPTLVRPIVLKPATVQGFVYWNTANNSSYIPRADSLVPGATLHLWGPHLTSRSVTTDASGAFVLSNVAPGVYNCSVTYLTGNFSAPQVYANAGATVNETRGLTAAGIVGLVFLPSGLPAPGATVTASTSANGVVASTTTNSSGGFSIANLGTGNYSVRATLSDLSYASPPRSVDVLRPGLKYGSNLTLGPVFTLDLSVVANGNPASNIPVRFTPITALAQPPRVASNGTSGPPGGGLGPNPSSSSPGVANSSVFFSDANGFVSATLPVGNYSVYALGYAGSTMYAGFEDAYLPPGTRAQTLAPLFLAPAQSLGGLLLGATTSSVQIPIEIFVYNDRGDVVTAFVNATGTWGVELPDGTYSVVAVQGLTTNTASLTTAWARATVLGDTKLTLSLVPAVALNALVGYPICCTSGAIYPAASAVTKVTLEPLGATVAAVSSSNGNVSVIVPAALGTGSSFCLAAAAPGYLPYSQCGLTATQLQATATIPLGLATVPVNITISGLPSGTQIALNVTAKSPTAQSVSATGTTSFSLALRPGS